jgi:hypothetical protein
VDRRILTKFLRCCPNGASLLGKHFKTERATPNMFQIQKKVEVIEKKKKDTGNFEQIFNAFLQSVPE